MWFENAIGWIMYVSYVWAVKVFPYSVAVKANVNEAPSHWRLFNGVARLKRVTRTIFQQYHRCLLLHFSQWCVFVDVVVELFVARMLFLLACNRQSSLPFFKHVYWRVLCISLTLPRAFVCHLVARQFRFSFYIQPSQWSRPYVCVCMLCLHGTIPYFSISHTATEFFPHSRQ